jgi:hypothetical protein
VRLESGKRLLEQFSFYLFRFGAQRASHYAQHTSYSTTESSPLPSPFKSPRVPTTMRAAVVRTSSSGGLDPAHLPQLALLRRARARAPQPAPLGRHFPAHEELTWAASPTSAATMTTSSAATSAPSSVLKLHPSLQMALPRGKSGRRTFAVATNCDVS